MNTADFRSLTACEIDFVAGGGFLSMPMLFPGFTHAEAGITGFGAAAAQAASSGLPVGTIVPNLPPGCQSIVISGVNYFNCNGIYYRAGFQGNNIVYIVSAP